MRIFGCVSRSCLLCRHRSKNGMTCERMERCKQIIRDSLEVVAARCRAKKLRFDLDELLRDLFPEEAASMTQEKK